SEDLNVNTKIAGNEISWKVLEDPAFRSQLAKEKPELKTDKELVRKIYLQLAGTPTYTQYTSVSARDKSSEKKIVEFILNDMLLANEIFVAHVEEIFSNWDDDGEMVVQLLSGYLQKPGSYNFNEMMSRDKAQ